MSALAEESQAGGYSLALERLCLHVTEAEPSSSTFANTNGSRAAGAVPYASDWAWFGPHAAHLDELLGELSRLTARTAV